MKRVLSLAEVFDTLSIRDGATLSFHHHLRNGDAVLNLVLDVAAQKGLRDLHVAASGIFPVHVPLIGHIRSGVVTRLSSGYIAGPVGEAISRGILPTAARLLTHGGRARLVEQHQLPVDVAFIAASAADHLRGLSGQIGPQAFGAMGYPQADSMTALSVVGVTDTIVQNLPRADIPGDRVDLVAQVDSIGKANEILSGTTQPGGDIHSAQIGQLVAKAIAACGVMEDGFSFQAGAGSIPLAAAQHVGLKMSANGVKGAFASGGIMGFHVDMLNAGLFAELRDVQCFDERAVASVRQDPRHKSISASAYAGPHVGGAVVDRLSAVLLGAAEVDTRFNINVSTRADGGLNGGSGGHTDTAQGAGLTVIATRLTAAGYAKVVPKVRCVTTPGRHVDLVVTERGIAVSPARPELADRLAQAGLMIMRIEDLERASAQEADRDRPEPPQGLIVATCEDRHGRVTDKIRQRETTG